MTVTVAELSRGSHSILYKLSWTADGDGIIDLPDKNIRSIAFDSDGNDGGGTLTWFVSVGGTTYSALGVTTSADPANPTSVTSATAAGNFSVHVDDVAYQKLKFTLGSSSNPTLIVYVRVTF